VAAVLSVKTEAEEGCRAGAAAAALCISIAAKLALSPPGPARPALLPAGGRAPDPSARSMLGAGRPGHVHEPSRQSVHASALWICLATSSCGLSALMCTTLSL
jgi:hypothetical protein